MGRYSKSYSNYVLRKRHKDLENGTIFERDWGTLGERHVIESGKKRIYADSNFLFTDNTRSGNKYRNNTGEWSDAYTKDMLGDKVDNTVNDTSLLDDSNDIRDYAYYGSAVELVRASVENIIKWFPGRFWSTNQHITRLNPNEDGWIYVEEIITDGHHNYAIRYSDDEVNHPSKIFVIRNPFTIDFYSTNVVLGKYDNSMRNMPLSFKQYELNGEDIHTWDVWIKPYSECDDDYTIKYDIKFTYGDEQSGHIYGMVVNKTVVWCTTVADMVVQPKQNLIDEYFAGLSGFEAKLVSRENNPIYTSKFITPIPYGNNNPNYYYVERAYSWPHDGYCISVDTIGFENFFNSLYDLATKMDELWCDNIWRNMTHEAITNFDWTYTKEYEEGEEQENILGGTRMEGILRIWGRCFDDIKRYIDGISLKNCVTYDTNRNLANAELSDKAGLLGWEVYSTKLNKDDNLYLTNEFIDEYINKLNPVDRWGEDATVTYEKWFNSRNPEAVSQNMVDNDFMSKLILSSGEIFRTKGTRQAVEMVFGMFGIGNINENKPEIEFKERYYTVTPKRRDDIFCYYRPIILPDRPESYTEITGYDDLFAYIEDNPVTEESVEHIVINGKYYDLISDVTVGEFCENMVYAKSAALNYEDDVFSGTPIKEVYINNDYYIVPYFTQDKVYDGDVQFETKGGWGKSVEPGYILEEVAKQEFDYLETIPYMEIVQNVASLMNVNAFQIGEKRIFYVIDISDLTKFAETIPTNVSHIFKLAQPNNPNLFASWRNIPSDGVVDPSYDIFEGVTEDDIKQALYDDKLSLDNIGNNPHCGYSAYDLGTEYLEYLKMPFKYPVENYGFSGVEDEESARQFTFEVVEHNDDKIVNLIGNDTLEYVLPSKMLIIKNNITNEQYKNYLREVIMKYVLQVIPSTAILVLEDSEYTSVKTYYYTTNNIPSARISIENCSSFDGESGNVGTLNDLTIIVAPETTTVTLTYASNGIESVVTECNEQPCLIEGDYVSDLPEGYKALMYYFRGMNAESARITIE